MQGRTAIQLGLGPVIAQLTLFFWKRLFSADDEAHLWSRSLKRLFPDKRVKRGEVATHLEILYQARNRIAHHEPIYGQRLASVLASVDFATMRFDAPEPGPNSVLAKVVAPYRPALDLEVARLNEAFSRPTVSG